MRKTEVLRKYKYFQIKREQGDIEKAACSVCSNIWLYAYKQECCIQLKQDRDQ